ncbi:hypothetical protein MML48_1g14344 [Holotrichia oblita]|uniref:Uncharacterized protein n=1 Tax=Holotrichia oblita TaxID=644536 RepID=A0ACB9TSZ8_HOLOL|nr:hypothetical protein MML48_1g14344 [Holotrichia oblita]
MLGQIQQEENTYEHVQKRRHSERRFSSFSFFDEQEENLKTNHLILIEDVNVGKSEQILSNNVFGFEDVIVSPKETSILLYYIFIFLQLEEHEDTYPTLTQLDASCLRDFPAKYAVRALSKHQFPAKGVYVDDRIIPGFKYRVQRLPDHQAINSKNQYLFHGNPLTLTSISRGYGRRFTFERNQEFPDEENYFYSDNHYGGYGFEIHAISKGDKFTIYDANHEPQGILDITEIVGKQIEMGLSHKIGKIERKVQVKFIAKVEFYDSGILQEIPLSGCALCVKHKDGTSAKTIKIVGVCIRQRNYYLIQGYHDQFRRIHVRDVDIPTKYTITGLSSYELPVIGTYVDPRIVPGFHYKVRISNRKKYLFNGQSLRLQSIGAGYGKKLTFELNSHLNAENYLWSDSHQDGLACEVRVVMNKMKFSIVSGNQILGEATVFRTDLPQIEERMEKVEFAADRYGYIKYVHVDVMCHIKVDINDSGEFHNENLVRVYGLAIARKDPGRRNAYVEQVINVGLDSQLNLIFARSHKGLIFLPKY